MNILLRIIPLTLVLMTIPAHAQFSLEPWLGFENGEMQRGATDYSAKGVRYGIRLGYDVVDKVTLGFDYGLGSVEIDSNPSDDLKLTEMGIFGALKVAEARAWLEYIFSSEGEYNNNNGKVDGSGTKVGFGYFVSPGLSLNLEKTGREYKNNNNVSAGDLDTFIFSVSFVF